MYRVLLTGITLMQTGRVEANLGRLNETAKLTYLDDLIRRKVGDAETERLSEADFRFHRANMIACGAGSRRHTKPVVCRKSQTESRPCTVSS